MKSEILRELSFQEGQAAGEGGAGTGIARRSGLRVAELWALLQPQQRPLQSSARGSGERCQLFSSQAANLAATCRCPMMWPYLIKPHAERLHLLRPKKNAFGV